MQCSSLSLFCETGEFSTSYNCLVNSGTLLRICFLKQYSGGIWIFFFLQACFIYCTVRSLNTSNLFFFFTGKLYFTVVCADTSVWFAAGEKARISFLWCYTRPGGVGVGGCVPSETEALEAAFVHRTAADHHVACTCVSCAYAFWCRGYLLACLSHRISLMCLFAVAIQAPLGTSDSPPNL